MPQPQHWAILGSGLLGMTVALRLAQQGQRVSLYESSKELGGLASAWQLGDITWDRHYHVTLLSDSSNRSLLRELGLEQELNWVETKTGFYTGGRMVSMSNSLEFLKFPPINLIDKARLALTILHASRIEDWKALERIPVEEWLRKWSGANTTEKIWLPPPRAKLGANYTQASAAFIWATIARMYAARRSGLKKEMFGYVRGGYARVLARFEELLRREGVEIRVGQKVRRVVRDEEGGVLVETLPAQAREFDKVV